MRREMYISSGGDSYFQSRVIIVPYTPYRREREREREKEIDSKSLNSFFSRRQLWGIPICVCLLCEMPFLQLLYTTQKNGTQLRHCVCLILPPPPKKKMKGRFFCGEVPCLITGGEVDISCGFFFLCHYGQRFFCVLRRRGGGCCLCNYTPPPPLFKIGYGMVLFPFSNAPLSLLFWVSGGGRDSTMPLKPK